MKELVKEFWLLGLVLLLAFGLSAATCGGGDDDDDDDTDDDADDDTDDDTEVNYAVSFDGIDDYVVVPDSPSLDVTTGMTIEAWVYVRSSDSSQLINIVGHYDYESADINQGWLLRIADGRFRFEIMNDSNHKAWADTGVNLNKWIHVAGTFDGEAVRLWVDGVKVKETPYDSTIGQPWGNLYMATNSIATRYFFDGIIDEVRLSSAAQYDATFTPSAELAADSHTIGLWHFDEGEGDIAYDSSGFDNHGTLHGAEWVERE